jgi:Cu/Ag efflux pump CusA
VAVKVFGDDLIELRRAAQDVRRAMEGVPGVADLAVEQQADIPFLSVKLDRGAVARYGLRAADVAEAVKAAFAGVEVSRVRERQRSFDLMVRYDRGVLADLDAVRSTRVVTHSGAELPLHALAAIETTRAPNTISRENVQRKIVVMCNVAGRDLRGVVADVRRAIEGSVKLPRGYHVEYGGQFERAEEATRTLLWLGLASIAGTFVLLFVALGTARDAWLVLVNLPLALVGGVAGVFLSGGVLSVASLVGFITLFGIATRHGLMLVLHVHHVVTAEGERDFTAAVVRASRERLVPVLMTALAAGLALVPLVLAAGEPGSEIQAPMAVVIVCGLLSSTALTMLVVPALYLRFGALRPSAPAGDAPCAPTAP